VIEIKGGIMKYHLDIGDAQITVITDKNAGTIESNLHATSEEIDLMDSDDAADNRESEAAIDGLESLILACACNGIKIDSKEFVSSIQDALIAIENNY
jgi:hypothetical protein